MTTSTGQESSKPNKSGGGSAETKQDREAAKDLKEDLDSPSEAASDATSSNATPGGGDAAPGSDAGVSGEESLLPKGLISNIVRERKRLATERAELEQAQKDLKLAKKRLSQQIKEANANFDARIKELKALRDQVAALKNALTQAQAGLVGGPIRDRELAHETKITHLVKLCERMPPESAAPYLEGLEIDVAAAVLSRMKVRKAALVIAAMQSSKAADLSKRYLQDDIPPPPGLSPKPPN